MSRTARLGVIDLGTNTFHLLLVEANEEDWQFLYRKRIFVNLAEIGIEQISQQAMDRGLDALREFKTAINSHGVHQVRVVGTAALRRAHNAADFLERVKTQTGFDVQVISGDQEAAWIARGVLSAVPRS
ncbi:MAG: hypothetical protein R3330_19260, partial [Saprospiraceae bacterium]|nr:hypothetical protein [Saprospiraceae bacterium]